jgi:hypothetical protein
MPDITAQWQPSRGVVEVFWDGCHLADMEPGTCPTPCDDDCEAPCHEAHSVTWKRDHDVGECWNAHTRRA